MVYLGNETPCDNGCGYVFQQDRKYDILIDGELKFVCSKCYAELRKKNEK